MVKKQKNFKKLSNTNKGLFSLNKLDFKKNWKKLSYLGLAGFLALSSVGYGIWKRVELNDVSAMSTIKLDTYTIYACATVGPSITTVKAKLYNGSSGNSGLQVYDATGKIIISFGPIASKRTSSTYTGFSWSSYMSSIKFSTGRWNTNGVVSTTRTPKSLATCPK
jgi:hypothetical protein